MSSMHALALRRALIAGGVLAATLAAHSLANPEVGFSVGAPFVWAQVVLVATLLGGRSRWRVRGFARCLMLLAGLQVAAHATITVAPWAFGLSVHHPAVIGPAATICHFGAALCLAAVISHLEKLLDVAVRLARVVARALDAGPHAQPRLGSTPVAGIVRPRGLHLRRLPSVRGPAASRTRKRSTSN